jgi:hypothetical protein
MTSLKVLDVSGNKLNTLCPFSELIALLVFICDDNLIQSLTEVLQLLANNKLMEEISFVNNPVVNGCSSNTVNACSENSSEKSSGSNSSNSSRCPSIIKTFHRSQKSTNYRFNDEVVMAGICLEKVNKKPVTKNERIFLLEKRKRLIAAEGYVL